jgi:osmotically-inducible protein OsmY
LLVAAALAFASVASAQTTGTGTAGTPTNTTGNGGTNQAGTGTATVELAAAPEIGSTNGSIQKGTVDSSNQLGGFYANPLYQGARSISGDLTAVGQLGGFGQPTFATGGSAATGSGNAAGRGTQTAGRTSTTGTGNTLAGGTTLGGNTTAGRQQGLGNTAQGGRQAGLGGTNQQNSNQQLSTGRSIAYTQTLKFGVAPMTMTEVQSEVGTMLATSSATPNVNKVQAVAGDFGTVILNGSVGDEDEARLIEGMVMLTPGVKQVKNDLKFPKK